MSYSKAAIKWLLLTTVFNSALSLEVAACADSENPSSTPTASGLLSPDLIAKAQRGASDPVIPLSYPYMSPSSLFHELLAVDSPELCVQSPVVKDRQYQANIILEEMIRKYHIPSIIKMGKIWQANSKWIEAYEWFTLAFQLQALTDGEVCGPAIEALKLLKNEDNFKDFLAANSRIKKAFNAFVNDSSSQAITINKYISARKNPGKYWQDFCVDPKQYQLANYKFAYLMGSIKDPTFLSTIIDKYDTKALGVNLTDDQRYLLIAYLYRKQGTPDSKFNLAMLYNDDNIAHHLSQEERYIKAAELFEAADTPLARTNLGHFYARGYIGQHLSDEERYNIVTALFTEHNVPEAKRELGHIYMRGYIGRHFSKQEIVNQAVECFKQAKTPDAYCDLGVLYKEGHVGTDLPDIERYEEAAKYFLKSKTPAAYCQLGLLYKEGNIGTHLPDTERYEEAAKYFLKANTPLAKWGLGVLYKEGYIGNHLTDQKRYNRAAELFTDSRTPDAEYSLGFLYHQGLIGQHLAGNARYEQAAVHYRIAKTPGAFCALGVLCDMGYIYPEFTQAQRHDMAAELFLQSGTADAKLHLSILYMLGEIELDWPAEKRYDKALTLLQGIESSQSKYFQSMIYYEKINLCDDNMERAADLETIAQDLLSQAQTLAIEELTAGKKDADRLLNCINVSLPDKADMDGESSEDSGADLSEPLIPTESTQPELVQTLVQEFTEAVMDNNSNEAVAAPKASEVVGPRIKSSSIPEREPTLSTKDKKNIRLQAAQVRRLETFRAYIKSAAISLPEDSKIGPLQLSFINNTVKKNFQELDKAKKIENLFEDIARKPYGTEGEGKPELLRGGKYKGCFSRRINAEDRLVYKVIDANSRRIEIFACKGHYK